MGLFSSKTTTAFPWVKLESEAQLDAVLAESHHHDIVLFKHSTTCSISKMAINRFENKWNVDASVCTPIYLDLLTFRSVSNAIAEKLNVVHESPQAILVRKGEVIHSSSHGDIDAIFIQTL